MGCTKRIKGRLVALGKAAKTIFLPQAVHFIPSAREYFMGDKSGGPHPKSTGHAVRQTPHAARQSIPPRQDLPQDDPQFEIPPKSSRYAIPLPENSIPCWKIV